MIYAATVGAFFSDVDTGYRSVFRSVYRALDVCKPFFLVYAVKVGDLPLSARELGYAAFFVPDVKMRPAVALAYENHAAVIEEYRVVVQVYVCFVGIFEQQFGVIAVRVR